MIDLASLAATAAAFFLVTVSPGPANIGCASVAMSLGRPAGLRFALGLALGLTFWGLLAATGMGAVLQASETALIGMKLLGAAYLLWLAYASARSATRPQKMDQATTGHGHWLWRGLLLNLTNPKAVFAWMAALAVGLDPTDGIAAVALATVICAGLGLVNYIAWAMLFSLDGVMALYARSRRAIDAAVAALFAIAGLGLIKSALSRAA